MKKFNRFGRVILSFSLLIAFVIMAVATGDGPSKSPKKTDNDSEQPEKEYYEETPEEEEEKEEPEPNWSSESVESDPVEIGEDDPIFEGGMED